MTTPQEPATKETEMHVPEPTSWQVVSREEISRRDDAPHTSVTLVRTMWWTGDGDTEGDEPVDSEPGVGNFMPSETGTLTIEDVDINEWEHGAHYVLTLTPVQR